MLGTGQWLKLHLWRLTQYRRVVYLDADTFVRHNMDELFYLDDDQGDDLTDDDHDASDASGGGDCESDHAGGVQDGTAAQRSLASASAAPSADGAAPVANSDPPRRRGRLATVNDYMAGAFFVVTPEPAAFHDMLAALSRAYAPAARFHYNGNGGGGYAYGEQDFLNDYWRGPDRRVVLDYNYHCLAEDMGTPGRDTVWVRALRHAERRKQQQEQEQEEEEEEEEGGGGAPRCWGDAVVASPEAVAAASAAAAAEAAGAATTPPATRPEATSEATCKLVEYASCDPDGSTGVRWKPWMDPSLLDGKRVCIYAPTDAFWRVHQEWLRLWATVQ